MNRKTQGVLLLVAGLVALPQFEHLPEDGHVPAGQAGQEVQRREHRAR